MVTSGTNIEFYYDVVCPYAYLASVQIEAVARRCGASVAWRPVLLGGLLRAAGGPDDPNLAMNDAKRRSMREDRRRWAARLGVTLREPPEHPRRTVRAMRLALAAPPGPGRVALSRALFEAYWVHGRDVSDEAVLAELAVRHGLPGDAFAAEARREQLRAATARATAAGAFGVPSFVVDGRLWWGQDRLTLLERASTGRSWSPWEVAPSPVTPARLTVFHDFASPFSYLAATQVERIAAARGVAVRWAPILLGALFRELGTPNVPLFEMNATKQAYVRRDAQDWAERWGVPFRFPASFPMRTVLPLRVALAEPAATLPIYRAAWQQGRSIETPAALEPVLEAAGFAAAALLERATTPAVKQQLRAMTERARVHGVHGVPVFEVERGGRTISIWGQDRLEMLAAVLDGWWPPDPA